jgi:hypothetical protein
MKTCISTAIDEKVMKLDEIDKRLIAVSLVILMLQPLFRNLIIVTRISKVLSLSFMMDGLQNGGDLSHPIPSSLLIRHKIILTSGGSQAILLLSYILLAGTLG